MKKNEKPSFIDFILGITENNLLKNQQGKTVYKDGVFDVNYTNHFKALYGIQQQTTCEVKEIVQNNRNKTITAEFDIRKTPAEEVNNIKKYCDERGIEFDNNKQTCTVGINRKSKGVLEERDWKKQ